MREALGALHPLASLTVGLVERLRGLLRVAGAVLLAAGKNVVLVLDELDRGLVEAARLGRPRALVEGLAKWVDEVTSRERWPELLGLPVRSLVVTSSDQAVAGDIASVGGLTGKGGLHVSLLWNLPREAFLELLGDAGAPRVDGELLWRLLGGNARALRELALDHGWDVEAWLSEEVVPKVQAAIVEEKSAMGLDSTADVQRRIGSPSPDELVSETPLRLGPLLDGNVLVPVAGARKLTALPREPWIGAVYAYQLPAYYWALGAMAERQTIRIGPSDVVAAAQRGVL